MLSSKVGQMGLCAVGGLTVAAACALALGWPTDDASTTAHIVIAGVGGLLIVLGIAWLVVGRMPGTNRLRAAAVVGLLAILVLTGLEVISAATAWPMIGMVLLIALAILLPTDKASWQGLVSGVKKVSIGPVALERIDHVIASTPEADDDAGDDKRSASVVELRLKLEAKLAFIAKYMLRPYEDGATFATIGSLANDKYLTHEEATDAVGVLTLRDDELAALSSQKRAEALKAFDAVVGRVRASVLHGLTKKQLDAARWQYKVIPRQPRDDLHAYRGATAVHLATVFVESVDSDLLGVVRERLRKLRPDGEIDQKLIVVPDTADLEGEQPDDDARVVKVGDLPTVLAALLTEDAPAATP